ncbi:MAG: HRDC domain-containing protein [Bacteroidota bacterium]
MQIKLFTIPIINGEALVEEMNRFMKSKKILHVESQLKESGSGLFWCFCIRYLDPTQEWNRKKEKVDYKELLDPESFKRFAKFRDIRRKISAEEAIPAYMVFTNEELAEMAKFEQLTFSEMKKIKGIGEKKMEKYGKSFVVEKSRDEKKKPLD